MKPSFSSLLVFVTLTATFVTANVEQVAAQGPIVRRLRERFNDGKPILPFVGDVEAEAKEFASKLKPARIPSLAPKKPTAAKEPTPPRTSSVPVLPKEKSRLKFPTINLQSGSGTRNDAEGSASVQPNRTSTGMSAFGLALQKVGDKFVVARVAQGGNAASAGLKRGDAIVSVGGAGLKVVEEFEAVEKAMRPGDQVEFEFSRRGGKPQKILVQFGKANSEPNETIRLTPSQNGQGSQKNSNESDSRLRSVLKPAPATNRIESLNELDFPALDGGK